MWWADGAGESRLKTFSGREGHGGADLARAVRRAKMPECPEIGK